MDLTKTIVLVVQNFNFWTEYRGKTPGFCFNFLKTTVFEIIFHPLLEKVYIF